MVPRSPIAYETPVPSGPILIDQESHDVQNPGSSKQARQRVAGAGPRPAGRARRAVLCPGRRRPADGGRRGHPHRLPDHRPDRHPRCVPRRRGGPRAVRGRVRGDDPAHHQQRSPRCLHLPGHRPRRRRGRCPGGAAVLHVLAGRAVRRARAGRGQPGRRPPGRARAVVEVGTGRLGGHHRAGPAARRHHRRRPRRPAHRGDPGHPRRDGRRARPPGGRAAQLRHVVPGSADLGRVRHLRRAGRRRRARLRRLRAGAGTRRGGPQRPADHPGGHLRRAGHDRSRVRRGGGALSQAAQLLFLTSLFAAALAFHNVVWRYMYALGRESVLPAALGRTGGNNIPKTASLVQSATGLVVIVVYAAGGWDPMTHLFFWLGTTGGFGIIILLALTSVAVIAFFGRHPHGESAWRRLIAPALAAVLLAGIVVLALAHYDTLLGVPAGATTAWTLPASYAVVAVIGLGWGLVLKIWRPQTYTAIGLGAHAVTGQLTPAAQDRRHEPPGDPRRRGRPGDAQPGHRRRLPRPGAVPVADRRPGRPQGHLPAYF